MSFLDITARDLLHAAYTAYVRARNRTKLTLNPERYRPFTSLPERVTFPYVKHLGRAVYIGPEADIMAAIRDNAPEFGAKVYELDRITRADHLGPTEAEYREVKG